MAGKMERINLLASGHRACPGCGAATAVRLILRALGKETIVTSATGCVETFTSPYGQSAWTVPWMHSLFENSAAVASGINTALQVLGEKKNQVIISGDGGTFDIGCAALYGMFERGHNITYICYDNEAYMNTGVQRSSATPTGAATTTTPIGKAHRGGKIERKKNMPEIALAHACVYVATASVSYPIDLMRKVAKANELVGPKYIQVHTPCTIGWGFETNETIEVGRKAVETGMVPLFEKELGKEFVVKHVKEKRPVREYLEMQSRFKHLLPEDQAAIVEELQKYCDENIAIYGI